MNVVIFGKGFGRPRQLNLSGRSVAVLAVLVAGALCSTAFVGGYWYSAQTGSGVSMTEVRNLTGELALQREAITTTRQQTEDTLDALAIRIGQMHARIIRLDFRADWPRVNALARRPAKALSVRWSNCPYFEHVGQFSPRPRRSPFLAVFRGELLT